MIAALASTLGVGVLSALVPVINMEIYTVGLLATHMALSWLAVGVVAAIGQMLGKAVFYCAGRGTVKLRTRLRRKVESHRTGRWSAWLEKFQYTCNRHPGQAAGILLLSASVGLPPLAIMAVAAGAAKVSPVVFAATGLVGRTARFSAIAASPSLLTWLV